MVYPTGLPYGLSYCVMNVNVKWCHFPLTVFYRLVKAVTHSKLHFSYVVYISAVFIVNCMKVFFVNSNKNLALQKCLALVKIFVGSSKILEDLHEDPYADLRRSL